MGGILERNWYLEQPEAAVLHWLQVADRGEEVGGSLVPEGGEGVQLLGPLIVGEVRLLHYQFLEEGVRFVLCSQGPRDAADDLEW